MVDWSQNKISGSHPTIEASDDLSQLLKLVDQTQSFRQNKKTQFQINCKVGVFDSKTCYTCDHRKPFHLCKKTRMNPKIFRNLMI